MVKRFQFNSIWKHSEGRRAASHTVNWTGFSTQLFLSFSQTHICTCSSMTDYFSDGLLSAAKVCLSCQLSLPSPRFDTISLSLPVWPNFPPVPSGIMSLCWAHCHVGLKPRSFKPKSSSGGNRVGQCGLKTSHTFNLDFITFIKGK